MEYKKNSKLTVTITDMGAQGEGIGKVDGYTLFVKDAIVGDTGVGVLSFACEDSTDGVWAWMSSGYASELSR